MLCDMDRADTDVLLQALEAAIKRRTRHRGRPVFYQMLEYDLGPILAASDEPAYVQARVREMLIRYGHAPEPPARGHMCAAVGDFAHLCRPAPPREQPGPPGPT